MFVHQGGACHDTRRIRLALIPSRSDGARPGLDERFKVAIPAGLEKHVQPDRTRANLAETLKALVESCNTGDRNIEEPFETLLTLSPPLMMTSIAASARTSAKSNGSSSLF
jgi:hypothetical protein